MEVMYLCVTNTHIYVQIGVIRVFGHSTVQQSRSHSLFVLSQSVLKMLFSCFHLSLVHNAIIW